MISEEDQDNDGDTLLVGYTNTYLDVKMIQILKIVILL